mmetsp:Transcript_91382/g.221908  ORF Transcript_91382/g.221908 Transcript_91382/m.221908 type:complete len:279 (-) Transcript_91382:76-912(-)
MEHLGWRCPPWRRRPAYQLPLLLNLFCRLFQKHCCPDYLLYDPLPCTLARPAHGALRPVLPAPAREVPRPILPHALVLVTLCRPFFYAYLVMTIVWVSLPVEIFGQVLKYVCVLVHSLRGPRRHPPRLRGPVRRPGARLRRARPRRHPHRHAQRVRHQPARPARLLPQPGHSLRHPHWQRRSLSLGRVLRCPFGLLPPCLSAPFAELACPMTISTTIRVQLCVVKQSLVSVVPGQIWVGFILPVIALSVPILLLLVTILSLRISSVEAIFVAMATLPA